MTKLKIILPILTLLCVIGIVCPALAETRINLRGDISETRIKFGDSKQNKFCWWGVEAEVERIWKPKFVISGYSFGIRKEGPLSYEGSLLFAGLHFRNFVLKENWKIIPSVYLIYGLPNIELDKFYGNGSDWKRIFLIRNANVPFFVDRSGVLYPEFRLKFRNNLSKWFGIDSGVSFSLPKIGIQEYRNGNVNFQKNRIFLFRVFGGFSFRIH